MVSPESTLVNNLRLPGQYFDSETGLHYNWHRYYDPGLGRYLRPDPIGLVGGIDLYGYAGNDPVSVVDPWGLVQWSGTSIQVSAIAEIGATFTRYHLESECINNRKAIITVWAVGPSVGLGVKASATVSTATFEDYNTRIKPDNFNGWFLMGAAGITAHPGIPVRPPGLSILPGAGPGVGISGSYIRLVNAFSSLTDNPGIIYGFDKSLSGTIGSSTVVDIEFAECGCSR